MHIASDCNELSVPSPCTKLVSQRLVWTYVCMYTHTHTINTHDIDKPAHTSTQCHSKNHHTCTHAFVIHHLSTKHCHAVLSGSCNYYLYTHKPNTNICTYMYACTHVHTQRCSVQDHSRVIVELQNVYVML